MKKMKYLLSLLIATTVSVSLTSCGDDDNETGSNGGKRISSIEVYDGRYEATTETGNSLRQRILFYYDKSGRVKSVDYQGKSEIIAGPQGYQLFYNIDGDKLTLTYRKSGSTEEPKPGANYYDGVGEAKLNSKGYIVEDYLETNSYELKSGDYLIDYYDYDDLGQVQKWTCINNATGKEDFTREFKWENGNLISGAYETWRMYGYSELINKTNLCLNYMFRQTFAEDVYALALCGYMGKKDTNLSEEWTLDGGGFPTSYFDGSFTYIIRY